MYRRTGRRVQGGNWAQMMRLVLFGPLVRVFFFSLLIYIYKYYRCYGATDRLTGGYNEKNGPKRMHIPSFGPFVSFYSCFFTYTDHITHFIAIIGTINLRRQYSYGTTSKTGPNDVFHVVWAISKCFFSFSCF